MVLVEGLHALEVIPTGERGILVGVREGTSRPHFKMGLASCLFLPGSGSLFGEVLMSG